MLVNEVSGRIIAVFVLAKSPDRHLEHSLGSHFVAQLMCVGQTKNHFYGVQSGGDSSPAICPRNKGD